MYDVGVMGNGALAGLVAITSGTSTVYPWGAIIIGLIAGALYVFASRVSIMLKVLPLVGVCSLGFTTFFHLFSGFKACGFVIIHPKP